MYGQLLPGTRCSIMVTAAGRIGMPGIKAFYGVPQDPAVFEGSLISRLFDQGSGMTTRFLADIPMPQIGDTRRYDHWVVRATEGMWAGRKNLHAVYHGPAFQKYGVRDPNLIYSFLLLEGGHGPPRPKKERPAVRVFVPRSN